MTTQTPDAVREAVARIIDPKPFEARSCVVERSQRQKDALAKADTILAALDSRAGDAGEPVAWQWERRGRYGPTDGATIGKWERVLTPYAPDTWPEADRRNIVPLYAATPAPAVDAVPAGEVDALRVDWNRRELADAYDMVEGMRQQIAQPAESPLNQSLLTVMDALEAADVEWSGITKTDRSSEA